MLLAAVFGSMLCLGLILLDWVRFTSLSREARAYGCAVARSEDALAAASWDTVVGHFGPAGTLQLPHGIARAFPEDRSIVLRPQYRLFAIGFRTAWPLRASIVAHAQASALRLVCTKRMPWSSAVITLAWFITVAIGSVAFLSMHLADEGWASLGGLLLGLGVFGLGLLVLAFGTVTVAFAYRLEDHRLREVYRELISALQGS